MIAEEILEVVRCSECRGPLQSMGSHVVCSECAVAFPITHGLPFIRTELRRSWPIEDLGSTDSVRQIE